MEKISETEILISDWWKRLIKRKKLIFAAFLIGFLAGLFIVFIVKPKFEAKLSFIINDSKLGMGSSLSAINSQLGILGVNSMSITDDRIIFLINSRKITAQALLDSFPGNKLIADEFISYYKLENTFQKIEEMKGFKGFIHSNVDALNYQENYAINLILYSINKSGNLIVESVKKKATSFVGNTSSGIIEVTYKHKQETLAQAYLAALYFELSKFYVKAMTNQQQELVNLIEYKVDSVEHLIANSDSEKARVIDQSIGIIRASGRVNEMKLRRSNDILNTLYAELLKNREVARFNLNQQKPVFELVDFPQLPLKKNEYSIVLFPLIASIVSVLLFIFAFSALYIYKRK
jgi:uncharacterized protein involved in exopolysaccharide biosynthesis